MAILKFSRSAEQSVESVDAHPFEPLARQVYITTGEDNIELVSQHAHANIPNALPFAGLGILYRQPLQIRRKGYKVFETEAMYGRRNWALLEIHIRGNTMGGGTVRLKQALQTMLTSAGAPNFGGLIGVNQIEDTVEGVEEELPSLDFSIDITYPVGFLTNAMMAIWSELTQRVNSVQWLGWPAGTVLYRGADFDGVPAGANTSPLNISHQVSVSPNLTNVTIAGFNGITKEGWDVLWWLHEDQEVGGVTVKKPVHWYVERTKLRAAFAGYLGFG